MLFDTFNNRYIITGTLETIDPIHIGSSAKNSLNPSETDMNVLKDNQGKPVIPGSSIKGVVRSYFEAIMRGIYPDDKNKVCNILDDTHCCLSKEYIDDCKKKSTDMKQYSELIYYHSCDVCKLFGGKEMAGKLQFKDCQYIGETPKFEYRDGVAIDRETGAIKTGESKNGAKYDFEIIPKGSKFDFYLIAENLDDTQKNQLDFILSILKGHDLGDGIIDYISVGGKTTRGLGRIRLINCEEKIITKDALKQEFNL